MASQAYDKSVFAKYFDENDAAVLAWAANVLEKLVADGTVANFILREDASGNETDFQDLFEPTCKFFSYFVQLARQFELFKEDEFLASQYLLNGGQYVCGDETIEQLVYAIQNSLRIRSQRGTTRMIEKVSQPDASPSTAPDGELLRLICWDALTFFKLGVARPEFNSWNMGHSSPCYRGNTGRYDLNIGYEYTEDVEDLDLYPLINEEFIFLTRYRGKNCMEIECGETAGIGITLSSVLFDETFDSDLGTFSNVAFGTKPWAWNSGHGGAARCTYLSAVGAVSDKLQRACVITAGRAYTVTISYFTSNSGTVSLDIYFDSTIVHTEVTQGNLTDPNVMTFTYTPNFSASTMSIVGTNIGSSLFFVEEVKVMLAGDDISTAKKIFVDPRIDFEITLDIAQDTTVSNITFGCLAFDADNNQVDLHSVVDGGATNYFFNTRKLNQSGRFYFLRGIIFNKDKELVSESEGRLNIGFGRNLRMNENVAYIIPQILLDVDASNDSEVGGGFDSESIAASGAFDSEGNESYDGQPSIFLWNIKVTPCSLPYSRAYLNNKNFIDLILDNKNGRYSDAEIKSILRNYFIPYNSAFDVV